MLATKKRALTSALLVVFVLVNLIFIFLQIHKQSQFVKISYAHQRLQKEKDHLIRRRNELIHQIHLQQSRKNVQKYAQDQLGMCETNVKQIHKISLEKAKSGA
jgi:hypothetical protein